MLEHVILYMYNGICMYACGARVLHIFLSCLCSACMCVCVWVTRFWGYELMLKCSFLYTYLCVCVCIWFWYQAQGTYNRSKIRGMTRTIEEKKWKHGVTNMKCIWWYLIRNHDIKTLKMEFIVIYFLSLYLPPSLFSLSLSLYVYVCILIAKGDERNLCHRTFLLLTIISHYVCVVLKRNTHFKIIFDSPKRRC